MKDYIIKEVKLEVSQQRQPKLICHQINDGEKKALLHDIEFESIEIYNVDSIIGIIFITENNIQIDLTEYNALSRKYDKNIILDLENIEAFKAINIPNWFLLKSKIYENLRGIVKVKLRY